MPTRTSSFCRVTKEKQGFNVKSFCMELFTFKLRASPGLVMFRTTQKESPKSGILLILKVYVKISPLVLRKKEKQCFLFIQASALRLFLGMHHC